MKTSLHVETQKLISLNPKVIERMAWLRGTGTTGLLLAEKAETIIARLKSGEAWSTCRRIAPRTANGEKRIRKCVKYDLGWGFRLITLLRNDVLYICYLGTHDECDRWLSENRRVKNVELGRNSVYRVVPQTLRKNVPGLEKPSDALDDLDKRLQELPDRALRRIFCGLVEEQ